MHVIYPSYSLLISYRLGEKRSMRVRVRASRAPVRVGVWASRAVADSRGLKQRASQPCGAPSSKLLWRP